MSNVSKISNRVKRLLDEYKPYIGVEFHPIIDHNVVSEDIPFVCFMIFAVWFCGRMGISIRGIQWKDVYGYYAHIPFHSFLISSS